MGVFDGKVISVCYTNWRGETRMRRLIPHTIAFQATEWHPGAPQWMMLATDAESGSYRWYPLQHLRGWQAAHNQALSWRDPSCQAFGVCIKDGHRLSPQQNVTNGVVGRCGDCPDKK